MLLNPPPKTSEHWILEQTAEIDTAPGTVAGNQLETVFWTVKIIASDNETAKKKFAALQKFANMLDSQIEEKSIQKWNSLVDAFTPDVPLSPNKIIEARMRGQAMAAILGSNDFVRASDIAEAAHFSTKNPSSQPNRWKRSQQIFAIEYKGVDLYPFYALDPQNGFRPLPIMTSILAVLAYKDSWHIAFWFGSLNSYLDDQMPKDLLLSEPERVLKAAQLDALGLQHG